jgi:uncharacterized protein involved in response to NO
MRAVQADRPGAATFRLLFPLGAVLAGAGVLPWILFALGWTELYRPIFPSLVFRSMFHPLAEVEGFLTCFAAGFLFAFVPRRTGTSPPARWQVAVAIAAPVAIVGCTMFGKWVVAQAFWLALLAVLFEFALRRALAARSRLVPGFVWIGFALLMGACGAVLAGAGALLGRDVAWLHEVGRGLLLQGLFTGLALGTAPVLLPALAGGEEVPRQSWPAVALHTAGAAAFCASFVLGELISQQLGFGIRAVVAALVVTEPLRATSAPVDPGLRRGMARLALLLLPIGNAWVAVSPGFRRAGLHVVYLGCFAALVLAASTQVTPARTRPRRLLGLAAGLLAVALAARVLLELDPPNFKLWLGTASAAFSIAMIPWAALTRRRAPP